MHTPLSPAFRNFVVATLSAAIGFDRKAKQLCEIVDFNAYSMFRSDVMIQGLMFCLGTELKDSDDKAQDAYYRAVTVGLDPDQPISNYNSAISTELYSTAERLLLLLEDIAHKELSCPLPVRSKHRLLDRLSGAKQLDLLKRRQPLLRAEADRPPLPGNLELPAAVLNPYEQANHEQAEDLQAEELKAEDLQANAVQANQEQDDQGDRPF